ncbi:MAG TPA: fatty acid metabolism transcriptional regulator FadR [Anaerolineae bacterium]|nr:fatty acid metabolism transcriptional regulator FadR [Anaerolineae bacterium]
MTNWQAPPKPIDYAEKAVVTAILDGTFPPNSTLPGERTLSAQLGITRPTLREVIRRLERDGWLTVQHGKSTRINNFWQEGGLNLLSSLIQYGQDLPPHFIPNLLQVRLDLAPSYTRLAAQNDPQAVVDQLANLPTLDDTPLTWAQFDWHCHHRFTILAANPIYTLILNGFDSFYVQMAQLYFALPESRAHSLNFYQNLHHAVTNNDLDAVFSLTKKTMADSLDHWSTINSAPTGGTHS